MKKITRFMFLSFFGFMLLYSCGGKENLPVNSINVGSENSRVEVANPAAVYCKEQNKDNKYVIRKSKEGDYGVCIFPNGKECIAWEYFRGECKPE